MLYRESPSVAESYLGVPQGRFADRPSCRQHHVPLLNVKEMVDLVYVYLRMRWSCRREVSKVKQQKCVALVRKLEPTSTSVGY
jgi:hypothetical protein